MYKCKMCGAEYEEQEMCCGEETEKQCDDCGEVESECACDE